MDSKIRILAVDDDPNICELSKEFLEMSGGIKVDIASSVKEARDAMCKTDYDLILSDYQMPEEDGIQFLKSLRRADDLHPFILFTGKGREEVAIDALNSGADAYLQKGEDPTSLYAGLKHHIETIVRKHRAEAALVDSEAEYHSLFEDSPDPIIVLSMGGVVLNCNQAALDMVSMDKSEIVGHTLTSLGIYSQEDITIFQRTMAAKMKGAVVSPISSQVHRRDGSMRWVEIRSSIINKSDQSAYFQIIARDITKRKMAEDALTESEKKYRLLVDGVAEAIIVVQDEKIVMANRIAITTLGYSEEEIISKSFITFVHPDDRNMLLDRYQRRLRGEQMPDRYDFRFLTKDGSTRWVAISAMVIEWEGRSATLNLLTDITDRKRIEEEIRESEIKYRSVVERAAEAIFVLQDGKFQLTNPTAEEITGLSEQELRAIPFTSIIHPDDLAMVEGRYRRRLSGKEAPNNYSFRLILRDGSEKWVQINAIKIDWKGRPATLNLLTNITELKRTEEELLKAQGRLRVALDIAMLGAWEYDVVSDTFTFDEQFYKIYGTTSEIEGGMSMSSEEYARRFIPPSQAEVVKAETDAAIETKDPDFSRRVEHEIIRRDGERRILSIFIRIVKDKSGRTIRTYGVNQDITDIVRTQKKLRETIGKLNLLSGITRHDITNQLTVLTGNLSMMENGKLDYKLVAHLKKAEIAAERISTIIHFTKEYEDIGVQAARWHDVRVLISAAANGLNMGAIHLVNDVPDGIEVLADPMIKKVFYNLIDNAIRHGGHVTKIRFSVDEADGLSSIIYEDDGIGLSEKVKGTIFTKSTNAEHGFGLFLSREILTISNIEIAEMGEPGKGAKFVMTVPANGYRKNN